MPLTRPVLAFVVILIGLTQVRFAERNAQAGLRTRWRKVTGASSAWPDPHVAYDREAVGAYFAVVVNKGWCQQNTLGDLHFLENGAELNELGRIKIRSIVTESPLFRRSLYVYRAETPEKTAAHMAAVERLASQIAPDGLAVPVMRPRPSRRLHIPCHSTWPSTGSTPPAPISSSPRTTIAAAGPGLAVIKDCRLSLRACEKMGTGTSPWRDSRGSTHRAAEPVPIFSQALRESTPLSRRPVDQHADAFSRQCSGPGSRNAPMMAIGEPVLGDPRFVTRFLGLDSAGYAVISKKQGKTLLAMVSDVRD